MSGQPIVSAFPVTAEVTAADRIAALFTDHHQRVYRLARRLSSTADDALDLVQETFLRAARAPNSVPRGADQEEAWLVRVLVNLRRDQWRKSSVRARHARHTVVEVQSAHGSAIIARATLWPALDP